MTGRMQRHAKAWAQVVGITKIDIAVNDISAFSGALKYSTYTPSFIGSSGGSISPE